MINKKCLTGEQLEESGIWNWCSDLRHLILIAVVDTVTVAFNFCFTGTLKLCNKSRRQLMRRSLFSQEQNNLGLQKGPNAAVHLKI